MGCGRKALSVGDVLSGRSYVGLEEVQLLAVRKLVKMMMCACVCDVCACASVYVMCTCVHVSIQLYFSKDIVHHLQRKAEIKYQTAKSLLQRQMVLNAN